MLTGMPEASFASKGGKCITVTKHIGLLLYYNGCESILVLARDRCSTGTTGIRVTQNCYFANKTNKVLVSITKWLLALACLCTDIYSFSMKLVGILPFFALRRVDYLPQRRRRFREQDNRRQGHLVSLRTRCQCYNFFSVCAWRGQISLSVSPFPASSYVFSGLFYKSFTIVMTIPSQNHYYKTKLWSEASVIAS